MNWRPAKMSIRSWTFGAVCCAPLITLRILLLRTPLPLHDFISYWAAGRLFLERANPYWPAAMLSVERSQGWLYQQPLLMLSPPWMLPLAALISLQPLAYSRVAWLGLSVGLNLGSAIGLWRFFGGKPDRWWIALLVVATFIPMGTAERMGQITILMLASMTAFLLLLDKRRDFAAGLMLLGLGLKPHLLYLVLLAIMLWAVQQRRWAVLAGAFLSYAVTTLGALLYDPSAIGFFRGQAYNAAIDTAAGVGGALRLIFGAQHTWLQFLPTVAGAAWFGAYYLKHGSNWDWRERLPLLLIVSVASSPYCWFHDFVLILPALIAIAARGRLTSRMLLVYLATVDAIAVAGFASKSAMSAASTLWIVFYLVAMREAAKAEPIDAESADDRALAASGSA